MSLREELNTLRDAYEVQKERVAQLEQYIEDLLTLHPILRDTYCHSQYGDLLKRRKMHSYERVRSLAESVKHVANLSASERETVDNLLRAALENTHTKEDA